MARKTKSTILREGRLYLGVMLIIFLAALIRDINLLLMLFALMAGLLLLSWRNLRRAFDRFQMVRRLPRRISAGEILEVEFEATNGRRRGDSWSVVFEDRIERQGEATTQVVRPAAWLPRIGAGQTRRVAYRCNLNQRGVHRFGPTRVVTHGVLGLLRRSLRIDRIDTLIVGPRLGRIQQGWMEIQHEAFDSQRRSESHQAFLEGEFHSLRNWRSGDTRRWIHWRTSARKGELMVRQFERPSSQDLTLVIELWQPNKPGPDELENVELAVSFAGTLLAEQCRRGGNEIAVAVANAKQAVWNGAASMAFLDDCLDGLAVAEAAADDHLPDTLRRALALARPGSQFIVLSSRAVDLADTARFATLWEDGRLRNAMGRVRMVDASDKRLDRFFAVT